MLCPFLLKGQDASVASAIYDRFLIGCLLPWQTFLLRCPEPCRKTLQPCPPASVLPFSVPSLLTVNVFVFHPPSVPIYLSIAYAWRESAPQRRSRRIFSLLFRRQKKKKKNVLQEFVDIMSGFDTVSKVSPGEWKLPRGTAFDWCRPSLLLCDVFTDAVADGVRYTHRSWSAEQLARVPQPHGGFTVVSDHVFSLCYEIRAYFILGLARISEIEPREFSLMLKYVRSAVNPLFTQGKRCRAI